MGTSSSPRGLTVFDGALYFTASDGVTGSEVWRHNANGTTERVTDINPGSGSGVGIASFTEFNGELYFRGSDTSGNIELWKINGAGQAVQVDIDPNTAGIQEIRPGASGAFGGFAGFRRSSTTRCISRPTTA